MEITVAIGILAACYGVSRVMLRLGVFPAGLRGLRAVHLASALAVLVVDLFLKYNWGGFTARAAIWIAVIQFVFYLLDRKRGRVPANSSG